MPAESEVATLEAAVAVINAMLPRGARPFRIYEDRDGRYIFAPLGGACNPMSDVDAILWAKKLLIIEEAGNAFRR